jgi:hypothetical protein
LYIHIHYSTIIGVSDTRVSPTRFIVDRVSISTSLKKIQNRFNTHIHLSKSFNNNQTIPHHGSAVPDSHGNAHNLTMVPPPQIPLEHTQPHNGSATTDSIGTHTTSQWFRHHRFHWNTHNLITMATKSGHYVVSKILHTKATKSGHIAGFHTRLSLTTP